MEGILPIYLYAAFVLPVIALLIVSLQSRPKILATICEMPFS